MGKAAILGAVLVATAAILRKRSGSSGRGAAGPGNPVRKAGGDRPRPPAASTFDRTWQPGYLTEYYPDAPKNQQRREGGRYDRNPGRDKHPVVTWQQHAADPKKYPFVTAASDLQLRGLKVPYGARLYLEAFPAVTFRLFDTGGHFFGDAKVYHGFPRWESGKSYKKGAGVSEAGSLYRAREAIAGSKAPPSQDPRWLTEPKPYTEPFDIAANSPEVPGVQRLGISGTSTRYWVDFDDVIDYPAWLAERPASVA